MYSSGLKYLCECWTGKVESSTRIKLSEKCD